MPAITSAALITAITDAISESSFAVQLISPPTRQPRRFLAIGLNNESYIVNVYAWTLTFGGRPSLPNEYRIQMTGVASPLQKRNADYTVLVGYDPDLNLFAGFDFERHRTFTTGSPSVQIDRTELSRAETEGLSFHRKSNDEIAVGIRPDMLMAYAANSQMLHEIAGEANVLGLLSTAIREELPIEELESLSVERQRIVTVVGRLSRAADFRQRVLFAYGHRCAVTRMQLRLVDAAHILPVGAPGSTDHVSNGIALSPTYHRAYDAGLIYLDESYRMQLNDAKLKLLQDMNLSGGIDTLRSKLGDRIFLPPDPQQRPKSTLINRANRFRQITV